MARGKKYSDEDMERGLQALAEAGGNSEEAARQVGIPATTLRGWKTNFHDEFVELRREKRTGFIDEVWEAARETIDALRIKVPGMGVDQLLRTFTTLTDKGLAVSGEAVDRMDITSGDRPLEGMNDNERIERLFAFIDNARAGGDSQSSD